jgi:hypothetical protein
MANITKASGHSSYTSYPDVANLNANTTYTISVTGSTGWTENDYAAWIDYNGDNYFDNNTERILYAIDAGSSASATFTLPANYEGLKKVVMRVRMSYWDDNPSPCGATLGEVEDYNVQMNFAAGVNSFTTSSFSIFPNPVKDIVTMQGENIDAKNIKIVNAIGAQMPVHVKSTNVGTTTLDVAEFAKGIYLLQSGNSVRKFTKD